MALAFSVLTPTWLLHVSDVTDGQTRTIRVQRHGAPGLLTWVGEPACIEPLFLALRERPAHDPLDLARQVALEAGVRNPPDEPATALLAGWGLSPEGHRAGWRWKVSNFEIRDDAEGFEVDGTWLVPSFAQPGSKGKAKAKVSFSVQVSSTSELPGPVKAALDRLERDLKREPGATTLATDLARHVTTTTGRPALLTLLRPEGSVEGGVLDGASLRPVSGGEGDGVFRVL